MSLRYGDLKGGRKMSLRKNLISLNYEEFLEECEYMLEDYKKTQRGGYGHTQPKDIQYLDKAIQRVAFEGMLRGDNRVGELQERIRNVLEERGGWEYQKFKR